MDYLFALIAFLISIIVSLFLGKLCEKKEKTDSGFEFFYWKLSYRRKLIRTIWMLPFLVIVMFLFQIRFKSYFLTCVIGAVIGIGAIIQGIYNYRKWKAEEQ